MAVDAKMRDAIERALGGVETMTPEDCIEVAAFVRESARCLTTARKSQIAEELAQRLERRAAAMTSHGPA